MAAGPRRRPAAAAAGARASCPTASSCPGHRPPGTGPWPGRCRAVLGRRGPGGDRPAPVPAGRRRDGGHPRRAQRLLVGGDAAAPATCVDDDLGRRRRRAATSCPTPEDVAACEQTLGAAASSSSTSTPTTSCPTARGAQNAPRIADMILGLVPGGLRRGRPAPLPRPHRLPRTTCSSPATRPSPCCPTCPTPGRRRRPGAVRGRSAGPRTSPTPSTDGRRPPGPACTT